MCSQGISASPYTYFITDGYQTYSQTSTQSCVSFQVSINQPTHTFTGYVADHSGCKTLLQQAVTLNFF